MESVLTAAARFADVPSESTSAPRPDSSDGAHGSPQNETAPEIFLSHSGRQKDFVERLYKALLKAGHSLFFDQESVPGAVLLSAFIKRCTGQSKLGVVVLSQDFVTTKWPMMELEILIHSSVPILPLFYKLSLEKLKDPESLFEWRREWEKIADKDRNVNVSKWEYVVKSLDRWSGISFTPKTSKALYIQNIVLEINKIIRPFIEYDLSHIKGKSRLIEEVEARFNSAQSSSDACAVAVGVHGIGGLGKTTLCKVMVNHYKAQYAGKCKLMEFPTKSEEKSKILEACKKILGCFASINDTLLEQVDNFDKAVKLMKEHMKLHKVFMAIDNVWDHSLEEVKRILEVGFAPGSRLLLTSRSEPLLKELLDGCDRRCVGRVPSMDQREALEVVESSFGKALSSLVSEDLSKCIVSLCFYNGEYHPLALKAMGQKLKRMPEWDGVQAMHNHLSHMNSSSQLVQEVIESSFKCIPSIRQHMFVDMAMFPVRVYPDLVDRPQEESPFSNTYEFIIEREDRVITLEIMRDLLRILYERKCSSHYKVDEFVRQLAFDGLVRFGNGNKVEIHDLYLELARNEAVSTSRRFYMGSNMEAVEWAKLERVVLRGEGERSEALGDCPRLEVLIVDNVYFSNGLRLGSMKSLRVLIIDDRNSRGADQELVMMGLEELKNLVVLMTTVASGSLFRCEALATLTQLQTLVIECHSGIRGGVWNLGGCRSLKILRLADCGEVDGDCLPPLTNLRCLSLSLCTRTWRKFPDLSGLSHLESLSVQDNHQSIETIRGLPSNLRRLTLKIFPVLREMSDMSTLTQLRVLTLDVGQEAIRKFVSKMHTLAQLETLSIAEKTSFGLETCIDQDIRDFPSNLRNLNIKRMSCKRLEMRTLIQLRVLRIASCPFLEDIGDLPPNIVDLALYNCPHLDVPFLNILTQLKKMDIRGCPLISQSPSEDE